MRLIGLLIEFGSGGIPHEDLNAHENHEKAASGLTDVADCQPSVRILIQFR